MGIIISISPDIFQWKWSGSSTGWRHVWYLYHVCVGCVCRDMQVLRRRCLKT